MEIHHTQPRCPNDAVLMRDIPDGYRCAVCGYLELVDDVTMPPEFDGPSIRGG